MMGTYEPLENIFSEEGHLVYFIAQDHFWKAESAISIPPFRGWFDVNDTRVISNFLIAEDEESETIEMIVNDVCTSEFPINLLGLPAREEGRGLLILNGKVVFRR